MDKLDRYPGLLSVAGFPPKDDGAFKNNWDHVAPAIGDTEIVPKLQLLDQYGDSTMMPGSNFLHFICF